MNPHIARASSIAGGTCCSLHLGVKLPSSSMYAIAFPTVLYLRSAAYRYGYWAGGCRSEGVKAYDVPHARASASPPSALSIANYILLPTLCNPARTLGCKREVEGHKLISHTSYSWLRSTFKTKSLLCRYNYSCLQGWKMATNITSCQYRIDVYS